MPSLRFALIGAGFWSRFQLAGWMEAGGAECVAVCNRTKSKAESLAREFHIPAVYEDAAQMLQKTRPDFVDIVTGVETHALYTKLAASLGIAVVCQKPLATSYAEAVSMLEACEQAGVQLYVNENWRWQAPIREFAKRVREAELGRIFRARIRMVSGFRVFGNQPFLRELEQFILTDIGTHVLDTARFLFGEAATLYCHTQRIHADIRGEDVATVMLKMKSGATVTVELGYPENYLEHDPFPSTLIFVEAAHGTAELGWQNWIRITTKDGTHSRQCRPPFYAWADPRYDIVHSSIVPCQANLLAGMRGECAAETTGIDNLRTLRLVFSAYESAASGEVVRLGD